MEDESFDIREHQLTSRERDFENALRPLSFEDFSGQDKVVDNLRIFVKAARLRGEALDHGNVKAYVDTLYAHSEMTTPRGLKRFLEQDSTYHIMDDPAVTLGIDLLGQLYEMNMKMQKASAQISTGERLFNAALREMSVNGNFYPDANSTMFNFTTYFNGV